MSGLVIVGVGGMGREVAAWWRAIEKSGTGQSLVGFVDDDPARAGDVVDDVPVLGPVAWLTERPEHASLIAIGSATVRAALDARLAEHGVGFATLIHPTAVIGPGVDIGPGSIIGPNVVLTRDVMIGRCAIMNYSAAVGHNGSVGDYAFVGPGAHLGGDVTIGGGAWIGIGASVVQGVTIGDGAIVGAGAAVVRHLPGGVTAVGVPARARTGRP
jgi:sugar O-acyltransferase (sialic acid O-acetyltransferase NeuD family)